MPNTLHVERKRNEVFEKVFRATSLADEHFMVRAYSRPVNRLGKDFEPLPTVFELRYLDAMVGKNKGFARAVVDRYDRTAERHPMAPVLKVIVNDKDEDTLDALMRDPVLTSHGLEVVAGDVRSIDNHDIYADVVTVGYGLSLLPQGGVSTALSALHKSIAEGGRLVIADIVPTSETVRDELVVELVRNVERQGEPVKIIDTPHPSTVEELVECLKGAGFVDISFVGEVSGRTTGTPLSVLNIVVSAVK